jgi:hypothetical protein
MYKQRKEVSELEDIIEINIKSIESPKIIQIAKNTSTDERKDIESLIKECREHWKYTLDIGIQPMERWKYTLDLVGRLHTQPSYQSSLQANQSYFQAN